MSDDRIDFSAIDPSRDGKRWERMVASLADRAARAARTPRSVPAQAAAWMGPSLALAAGVALLVWLTAPSAPPSPRPASSVSREDPAFALQRWALGESGRSVWEELDMLGVGHEQP
jgi:hypothetical protein